MASIGDPIHCHVVDTIVWFSRSADLIIISPSLQWMTPNINSVLDAMRFIPGVDTATTGEERYQAALRLQARAALLTPILTACYTRHGGAALIAVEGLDDVVEKD